MILKKSNKIYLHNYKPQKYFFKKNNNKYYNYKKYIKKLLTNKKLYKINLNSQFLIYNHKNYY